MIFLPAGLQEASFTLLYFTFLYFTLLYFPFLSFVAFCIHFSHLCRHVCRLCIHKPSLCIHSAFLFTIYSYLKQPKKQKNALCHTAKSRLKVHINLALQLAVIDFSAFVGRCAEILFKLIIGRNYGVALPFSSDEFFAHNFI